MPIQLSSTAPAYTVTLTKAAGPPTVIVQSVGLQGPPGSPGPQGQWDSMTQAEYDAIPVKDPAVLYVILP